MTKHSPTKIILFSTAIAATSLLMGQSPALAADTILSESDGKKTIARVNNEPITLEELINVIASSHRERTEDTRTGAIDYSAVLQRIINTRLILLEARNMGLDELPEIKDSVAAYSKEILMDLLLEARVMNVKAAPDEIDVKYRDIVKEYKIKAIKSKNEDDMKAIHEEIKSGKDFDQVMNKAVANGIAEGDIEGQFVKKSELTIPVASMISKMETGSVSPILSLGKEGFIIFKVEDTRLPKKEDPEMRREAEQEVLATKKRQASVDYCSELKKKYVNLDLELFESLDYEAETPGFNALLNDTRVIAEITGEAPLTVGEFTRVMEKKFYHGIDRAIQTKQVNERKRDILEDLLQRRVLLKEALTQKIDETDLYQFRMKEYERSIMYGLFVKKVLAPEIKLDMDELREYYHQNIEDYMSPKMVRIKSLVFGEEDRASRAMDKLISGSDFEWVSAHADGQLPKDTDGIMDFEAKILSLNSLPGDVRKALGDVKPGDFKLYRSPRGHFYILYIYHLIESRPEPFEEVKKEIAEKVYGDKLNEEIQIWVDKLKAFYPVKVYKKDLDAYFKHFI